MTFQDFQNSHDLTAVINEYKATKDYKIALLAKQYDKQENEKITKKVNYCYDGINRKFVDEISPNNKLASGFLSTLIDQRNQYLLGNGVMFTKPETAKRLGLWFNNDLQKLGRSAILYGKSYGHWADSLYTFEATEFVPLHDEFDDSLRAGVRFWQLEPDKPLCVTFYEEDGFTDYISADGGDLKPRKNKNGVEIGKQRYIKRGRGCEAFGIQIVGEENYSCIPIFRLNGNRYGQSALVGMKQWIDAYDEIVSGLANDFEGNSMIYWLFKNVNGMDEKEAAKILQRARQLGLIFTEDESEPEMKQKIIPYLERIESMKFLQECIYRDFGAFDLSLLASGQKTATEIKAAYLNMRLKTKSFEKEVTRFIMNLLDMLGIDDRPSYRYDELVNETELVQTVLMKADRLDEETVLSELGYEPEQVREIIRKREDEANARYSVPDVVQQDETNIEQKTDEAAL